MGLRGVRENLSVLFCLFSSIHSRRIVSREKVPGKEMVCFCHLLLTELDRRYIYFFTKNPQGTIYEISSHRTTFNENLSVRAIGNILRVRESEYSSKFCEDLKILKGPFLHLDCCLDYVERSSLDYQASVVQRTVTLYSR